MLWNDYFVVVYRILHYLYICLKGDEKVDKEILSPSSLNASPGYWKYILEYLQEDDYIKGVRLGKSAENTKIDNIEITPQGITYLFENVMMKEAKEFVENEPYATIVSGN